VYVPTGEVLRRCGGETEHELAIVSKATRKVPTFFMNYVQRGSGEGRWNGMPLSVVLRLPW